MELHQVRYFVVLCGTLNFTRAAQLCQVTQPALTRGIQRLERELGGPLLRRERNLTQLTELGRVMRPLLEQTLAMAETALDNANRFNKNEIASLRIGVPATVSAAIATKSLSEVAHRMPMLEVRLELAPSSEIVARLLEGELDGALLIDNGQFPERLNTWSLHTEDFYLTLPPTHPLANLDAIPLRALEGQVFVECSDCSAVAELKRLCAAGGIAVSAPHIAGSYEQAQQLAASGLGVALLPECASSPPLLVSRRLADAKLARSLVLAVVGGRRFSAALNAFVRSMRARDLRPPWRN